MVDNRFVKCQVCGEITRVRLQVGYLKKHPIVFTCGGCGISLKGTALVDQDQISLKMSFENADIIFGSDVGQYKHIVECSAEFPTEKQSKVQGPQSDFLLDVNPISPYMRYCTIADFLAFYDSLAKINNSVEGWEKFKRIFQLSLSSKDEFVLKELCKILECDSHEYEGDKHFLIDRMNELKNLLFGEPLVSDLLTHPYQYDLGCISDNQKVTDFISFLNSHNGYELHELEKDIYELLDEFVEVWQYLIPAYSLCFLFDGVSFDYENNGTTASSFSLIDTFYANAYETLGNLMVIPLGLDNILNRTGYDDCLLLSGKSCNMDHYIGKMTKGQRYAEANSAEKYMSRLNLQVEPQTRNAINHNDYDYDPISQIVTYYPNPKNRSQSCQRYLLQIEEEIIGMVKSVLVVSEYLYYLKKHDLINRGIVPLNVYLKSKKIVGRNEKCPCGSGKKYKYCHGRNLL